MAKIKYGVESWLYNIALPKFLFEGGIIDENDASTWRRPVTSILTTNENYGGHGTHKAGLLGPLCAVLEKAKNLIAGNGDNTMAVSSYSTDSGESYIATYKRSDGWTEIATYTPSADGANGECAFKLGLLDATGKFEKASFTDGDHSVFGMAMFAATLPDLLKEQSVPPLKGSSSMTHNEVVQGLQTLSAMENVTVDVIDLYALMCDAIYRRMGNPATTAKGIAAEWLINGYIGSRIPQLTNGFLQTLQVDPITVVMGNNTIEFPMVEFSASGDSKPKRTSTKFKNVRESMIALGAFKASDWSESLAAMIPDFPANDTVPSEAIDIAEAYLASGKTLNTFMLMGEAGSGKSTVCRYVSALVGMPFTIYSCNSNTDASDLLVALLPKSDITDTNGDVVSAAKTRADRWQDVTSGEEIACDPVTAWEKLTGVEDAEATEMDCWRYIATNYLANVGGNKFVSVKSPIVAAAEAGYCCEIQELDTVRDAAVVTALNSLLEEGIVTMPNGERVYRNPNSLFFFTVNQSYIGCNELNQAVYDRIQLKTYLNTPDAKILVARVKKETGCKDDEVLEKMADFTLTLKQHCNERGITDGSVGYRSFRAWVQAYMYHPKTKGNIYESALISVMATATQSKETYDELIVDVLQRFIIPSPKNARTSAAPAIDPSY